MTKKDPKWLEFKAEMAKHRNGLITGLLFRRTFLITYLLRNTKITPICMAIASFIIFLAAMPVFLYANSAYRWGYNNISIIWLLIGIILMLISCVLYCVSEELTIYKKTSNPLWDWLNSIFDRIKEVAVFITITFYAFLKHDMSSPETAFFLSWIGLFAVIGAALVAHISNAKTILNLKKDDYLINIGSKYMLSFNELVIFGITIAAITESVKHILQLYSVDFGVYFGFEVILLFFALAGPIFWITQIIMYIVKYNKQNKQNS